MVAALQAAAPAGVYVDDHHDDHGIIAVQGLAGAELIRAMGLPAEHDYMTMVSADFRGEPLIVCRTGYTGEHGYERLGGPGRCPGRPVGRAPRGRGGSSGPCQPGWVPGDTLRTEMGYPLHGQDISPAITPVEAMLGWAVGWDKPAFAGRDALTTLRAAGPRRRLRGLLALDRGIPRPHMEVRRPSGDPDRPLGGEPVGEVTSGTFSPTLKQGVGLALLDSSIALDDVVVEVERPGGR